MNIQNEIEKVAYSLWEKSGRMPGREVEHWVEAERIVMLRFEELSKPKKASKKADTFEKLPLELKKASAKVTKKESTLKQATAKKTVKKAEPVKEARKTK
ncbi:MAG: DUF2934 domain-containing protein [Nitrospirae bacterium]|nr:DUF2934 domain-containing protein [Nitrospirota bacterium]